MKRITFLLGVICTLFSSPAWSQSTNIAPLATISANGGGAAGCQSGPCSSLNDLNFGTCGSQQMWINTGGLPSTTAGVDWIQWDFPTVQIFDTLVIYHAQTNGNYLSGATVQYWDGTSWVTHTTFSGLPQTNCVNRVPIGLLAAQRFRITAFIPGSTGLQSNMNFREIEILEAPAASDDATVFSIDSPTVFCAGNQNVVVTIGNLGLNQIDSVDVNWEVNGIAQPTVQYVGLLDTANGLNPWFAQLTLGSFNFPSGNHTIKAWTTNPNGVQDTANFNDTSSRTVQTAAPPPAAKVSNISLNSAIGEVGTASGLDYVVVPVGDAPTSGIPVINVNSPFNITALTAGATYDLYVRKNCAPISSSWVGPTTFNTDFSLPYFEDFETFSPNITANPWPRGWFSSTSITPNWRSEDANNGFNENTAATGPLWDHTFFGGPTNGMYMYMETSGGSIGDTADFISPPIYIDSALTTVELGYWLFNHGSSIDRMEVLVFSNGLENLLANYINEQQPSQTDPWQFNSHLLNGYNGRRIQLIFRGINPSCCAGDIAIDDITINPVLPIDAGVVDVVSPKGSLCPGTISPIIKVKNYSSTQLDSVKIYWDVNGVLDSMTHTDTVAPGDTFTVTLGNVNISAGQTYNFTYFTDDVNGQSDQFSANDTLSLTGLITGLTGTITLDPSQASSATNFQTFASLSSTLNDKGVCGNVVVNVANGVYNDFLELSYVPGLSSINTLTIDGGDSSLTKLTHDASKNLGTVTLESVSHVSIRNMTIEASDLNSGVSVLMTGITNYNTISNCVLRVNKSSSSTMVTNVTTSGSRTSAVQTPNADANYNTISNNRIIGGYYGVRLYGNTSLINAVGNQIINNKIDSTYSYGIYTLYQDSTEVIANDIDMLDRSFVGATGIHMYANNNGKIVGNNVVSEGNGVFWSNANSILKPLNRQNEIINNMVSSETANGISIISVDSLNFWYNSVLAMGTNASAVYLLQNSSYEIDNIDFRNNILSTDVTPALRLGTMTDTVFSRCDYNCYYTVSGNVLVEINGSTIYPDLTAWQAASPSLNIKSQEGDPQFISPRDLHIIGRFVNDSGDATVPINVDIDGDIRPRPTAAGVDIGADEFDPPTCLPPLGQGYTSLSADSVTLLWGTGNIGNEVQVEWMPCGDPLGSGSSLVLIGDTLNVNGLNSATCYDFYVREICGRGDTSVWIGPLSFNTNIQAPQGVNCSVGAPSAFYTEEFDAVGGWTGDVGTGISLGQWNFGHSGGTASANTGPSNGAHSGANYVYVEGSGGVPPATMVSPPINLTNASGEAELSFWLHMAGAQIGNLSLGVGTSANGPFIKVFGFNGALQPTNTSPFYHVGIDLTSYIGQTIYLQFDYSGWTCCASDVAIDLLEVSTCVSCPTPDSLASTNVGLSTADLDWRENGNATQWEVSFGPQPTAPGSGTSIIVNTNPTVNLTTLNASTTYDWYVRAICGPADSSTWNAGGSFKTADGIPFIEDFETFTPGTIQNPFPRGWTSNGGTATPRWESEVANNGSNVNSLNTGPLWDHTFFGGPSNGKYMYMEASGGTAGDSVDFISPSISVGNNNSMNLKFHYFMHGADMRQLKVLIDTNGVENLIATIAGQQQTAQTDPWDTATYFLGGYAGKSVQIIFRGFNGASFTSDIAIDDIELSVPPPIDGGVSAIVGLESACGLGRGDSIKVEITNFGSQALSLIPLEYTVNGGTPIIETYNGNIPPGTTANYSFATTVNLSALGTYNIVARTIITGDNNISNDAEIISIDNIPTFNPGIASYVENFEFGPAGWTTDETGLWELGFPSGTTIDSAGQGNNSWVTNLAGNYPNEVGAQLFSPCFDFSLTNKPVIEFMLFYDTENNYDGGVLQSSIDSGATWQTVGALGDSINWYNTTADAINGTWSNSGDCWGGSNSGWRVTAHDLFDLANQPYVRLRFVFASDGSVNGYEGIGIDSVKIYNNAIVGVKEETAEQASFSIIPNPSTGLFKLNIESQRPANMNLSIRDIDGKLVHEEMISVNGRLNITMDLTDLAKGIYFMQVQNNDEIKVEKLVIQ